MPEGTQISEDLNEEMGSDEADALFERMNALRIEAESRNLVEKEQAARCKESAERIADEVASSGKLFDLSNPNNSAQIATDTLADQARNPAKKTEQKVKDLAIDSGQAVKDILEKSISEETSAEEITDQPKSPKSKWTKKQTTAAILGILGILGVIVYLVIDFTKKNQSTQPKTDKVDTGLDQVADSNDRAEANQTMISLLMQAATDAPFSSKAFKDFGITEATYQQLREQLLDLRDNITEEAHWQIMAQQATTIFPPSGRPYSLGDHMLALDLQYNVLAPLYDEQPLDFDVDATIGSLANHIDLEADTPVLQLYTNMMEEIPETSGATRLQRLILARMAIARAIATATPSA
jgi:hypothetical protein